MADRYINMNDGSGTSPYDTWAKGANTEVQAQAVLDAAVAGETIHAQGNVTLTAKLDIDTNSGDLTDGFIKLIGYNSSEVNDGSRFVIDADGAAANGIDRDGVEFWWLENIEIKNATANGLETGGAACNSWVFLNVSSNNNGGFGFEGYNGIYNLFCRCIAHSNTSDGWGSIHQTTTYLFCRSRDNTQSGWDFSFGENSRLIGCVSDGNSNEGYENCADGVLLYNCIANDNTDDGLIINSNADESIFLIGSRITNHDGSGDIGVNANSELLIQGWNYLENNDGDNFQNATLVYELLNNGATTTLEDQSDINQGYTDLTGGAEDYNLRSDATLRRAAITIPAS